MKNIVKQFAVPLVILLVFIGLAFLVPDIARNSAAIFWNYFKEMILIMPPVFVLMGLMEVWVPKNKIQEWLGSGSGLKGALIAFGLGTLPTGSLYVAFPIAASLIEKGASVSNIVLFLGSWAALKVPQLLVEIQFMGLAFAAWRFVLTLGALTITGLIMQRIISTKKKKA